MQALPIHHPIVLQHQKGRDSVENRTVDHNHWHIPMISICGNRSEISLGSSMISILGNPHYVTFKINKQKDSLIFFPCKSTNVLAYRVPDDVHINRGSRVRIKGKEFIRELLQVNGLDERINYAVPGAFVPDKGLTVFHLRDAFINIEP